MKVNINISTMHHVHNVNGYCSLSETSDHRINYSQFPCIGFPQFTNFVTLCIIINGK